MSLGGVPVEEATAKDFMMVRAALVRRVGGANEALVWTRIEFRASSARAAHQSEDGAHWWAATYDEIADETGLTAAQARRAVEALIEGGFLRAEHHHGFKRTRSYAPVFAHLSILPNGENDSSICQDAQFHLSDLPDVPLIETEDIKTSGPSFDDFWKVWPRREGKKAAALAWGRAVKRAAAQTIIDAATAYARSPFRPEARYVPHASTWLNGDRWDDPSPSAETSSRPSGPSGPSVEEFAPGDEWMAFGR